MSKFQFYDLTAFCMNNLCNYVSGIYKNIYASTILIYAIQLS